MTRLLISEHPMQVIPSLANRIGLEEAIVLQQIQYWLHNHEEKMNERTFREDRWWVFNTVEEWQKKQFSWWSTRTVQRILLNLQKMGLVTTKKFDAAKWNHRKWYTINYDAVSYLEDVPDTFCFEKTEDRVKIIAKFIENCLESTNTRSRQFGALQGDNLAYCRASERHDLLYKETSSKTTSEITSYKAKSRNNDNAEHYPQVGSLVDQEEKQLQVESNGSAKRTKSNLLGEDSNQSATKDSGVSRANQSKTVPPRNSPKKEKRSTYPPLEDDGSGILQIPDEGVYKFLRPLILKSTQIDLCRRFLDFEFDRDDDGQVLVSDNKNFDDEDEDTAFLENFPFQKMVDVLMYQENVSENTINKTIQEWADYWIEKDRSFRAAKKSLKQAIGNQDITWLIREEIGLEFESEKEYEPDNSDAELTYARQYEDIPF